MAAASLGAARPLRAAAGSQPHLWESDGSHRGRTGPRSLLSAVSGDDAECPAIDPQVAAPHLDRVCLSDPQASVGDRGLSEAQRRRLLWASGLASDGELHCVLPFTCDLQRASDHGGDYL